jgi:hypothetical protein
VTRTCITMLLGLLMLVAAPSEVQAGKKLYVGNLPYSATDQALRMEDDASRPPTPLQDIRVILNSGRSGTYQAPLGTLPMNTALGIVNAGSNGRGDTGFLAVSFTGAAGSYPSSSVFDMSLDFFDPSTGGPADPAAMKTGTVKFFNDAKGFGFVVSSDVTGVAVDAYSIVGRINSAHTGLTFSNVQVFQPSANSQFDVFPELNLASGGALDPNAPLFDLLVTPVPEPSTIAICAMLALATMGASRKRRR